MSFTESCKKDLDRTIKCTKCHKSGKKMIKCCLCKDYFCETNDVEDDECIYYFNNINYSSNKLPAYDTEICGNCSTYLFETCTLCGKERPGVGCGDNYNKYCHYCECECDGEHYSDVEEQVSAEDVRYAKKDIANIKENLKLLEKKIRKYSLGDINIVNIIKEYLIYYY